MKEKEGKHPNFNAVVIGVPTPNGLQMPSGEKRPKTSSPLAGPT